MSVLQAAAHCELFPATDALHKTIKNLPAMEVVLCRAAPCSSALKRLRQPFKSSTAFDLKELLLATRPVEDSIAFPTIEWNNDYDEDEDSSISDACDLPQSSAYDSDSVGSGLSLGKRSRDEQVDKCRLVRRKAHHTCLSLLENLGATLESSGNYDDSQRNFSWGQFSSEEDCSLALFTVGETLTSPKRRFRRLSASLSLSGGRY